MEISLKFRGAKRPMNRKKQLPDIEANCNSKWITNTGKRHNL